MTALPLLLFSASVTRVPLTMVGLLQYLPPCSSSWSGRLVVDEAMPTSRWIGFALVWTALGIFTWDGLRAAGAARRAEPTTVPVAEPA